MKGEFNKDMQNLRKKELNRNPGNKKFLKSVSKAAKGIHKNSATPSKDQT
jgi:hypothetical protein